MLSDLTVKQFANDLSSDSPAPGGGAAAALTGVLGASLISMVCNLTSGKEAYKDFEEEIQDALEQSQKIKDKLLVLIDEDAKAFSGVMDLYKLPKSTEEEKAKRTEALQAGFKKAAEVPYEIAEQCLEILKIAEKIVQKSNKNVISDVGVAVQSALSGLESSVLNVRVNLVFIKDEAYIKTMSDEVDKLIKEGTQLKENTYKKVLTMLS
ncbi:Formiminotetrahydrofolate cyclodeaminase [Candidatus Syntrophocurvum alkaliphilum]|uniref:Formiminotetrahydrofolate cyclodeaminase n=1 Tax=Candidatus Syntrophocurvum alkaliphilum TaxID=2293317 RepID=A0A6I6DI08_9FIRM|nr:cyclodeaminase/cyclohydrolase family protein [Candidatus Syntrophocurvum alkaliphilum]QGT99893.1 Formiminotetrahydrofolate cyclodeaminase [Candidatus Syntrophocurvum alkaliphilum]